MRQDDLLLDGTWSCGWNPAPRRSAPDDVDPASGWYPATVPGTAAAALLAAGEDAALLRDYDGAEWWFRCCFEGPAEEGDHTLALGGLATLADVWLDGQHLLRSENMFLAHELPLTAIGPGSHTLLLRFSPLADATGVRRPRPRWRSPRVTTQNLRFVRTTMLGRLPGWPHTPPPVGPWRPVTLRPRRDVEVHQRLLTASRVDDHTGRLHLALDLHGAGADAPVVVRVAGTSTEVASERDGATGVVRVEATVDVPDVELWWPHTHGLPTTYAVELVVSGQAHALGRVGFRDLEVRREDGSFTFVVNSTPLFARGSSWAPVDLIGFTQEPDRLRHDLDLVVAAGHNMVRVPGSMVYEDDLFLDELDQRGLLLWQDCMFAFLDFPDDPDLEASVREELSQQFTRLQGRPCLALVCGSTDTEEQASYQGVDRSDWTTALSTRVIPELLSALLPGTAYLRATPGDSALPTASTSGVCHYFGVPAYQRNLEDLRTAGIRFAAECLPLPTHPEPPSLAQQQQVRRGIGPTWERQAAVHRDFEDVAWDMTHTMTPYLERLFGVSELALRQQDADRLWTVQTATSVRLFEIALAEWRRVGSSCDGALTFYWRDARWGPGLGMVDSLGRPKATWWAMRRAMAPLAVLVTDEGLSGLGLHLVNDTAQPVDGRLQVTLFLDGEIVSERDSVEVRVPAHGGTSLSSTAFFPGFRDLSWAYRFAPPSPDVVLVELLDPVGERLAHAIHLPGGPARAVEDDLGLTGEPRPGPEPTLAVTTTRLAQWVRVETPDWVVSDSWFHLAPGQVHEVRLRPLSGGTTAAPRVRLGAFNSTRSTTVRFHSD